ncbi:hypothetical protein MKW92_024242 [Papaver armeniacum]|nr:hypothetical protein MKW92_024242 [Papaver armeniacum]
MACTIEGLNLRLHLMSEVPRKKHSLSEQNSRPRGNLQGKQWHMMAETLVGGKRFPEFIITPMVSSLRLALNVELFDEDGVMIEEEDVSMGEKELTLYYLHRGVF